MNGGSCQAGARRVESKARVVPLYMVEQRLEPHSGALEPLSVTQPAATHGVLTDIMGGRRCHAGVEWVVVVGAQAAPGVEQFEHQKQ